MLPCPKRQFYKLLKLFRARSLAIISTYKKTIMTKNSYQKPSQQTQEEALKIAKGTQRPAQTKEQTRLIAQGIQKGIDLYKKQQKEKTRDLSRKLKKTASQKEQSSELDDQEIQERIIYRQHWLPWLLLLLTWLGAGIYCELP